MKSRIPNLRVLGVGVFALVLLYGGEIRAQQTKQFTQYMLNTLSYNPGFAGLSNGICASLSYRYQWGTITDVMGEEKTKVNPWSAMLLVDAPIKVLKGGVSLELLSDNLGYDRSIAVKVGYTYHLQTSFGKIGIGLQGAFMNKNILYSKLKPITANDKVLEGKADISGFFGDVSVGAYLQGSRDYFVGISVSNIIPQYDEDLSYHIDAPLLTLNGGYTFGFPSLPKVSFTATTFLQTDFKAVEWDISALATFNNIFWGGVSYRLGDAVSILAGTNIANFRIGVAYDINTSALSKALSWGGGIEIFVKYCFGLNADKLNTDYKNSRYL